MSLSRVCLNFIDVSICLTAIATSLSASKDFSERMSGVLPNASSSSSASSLLISFFFFGILLFRLLFGMACVEIRELMFDKLEGYVVMRFLVFKFKQVYFLFVIIPNDTHILSLPHTNHVTCVKVVKRFLCSVDPAFLCDVFPNLYNAFCHGVLSLMLLYNDFLFMGTNGVMHSPYRPAPS